MTKKKKSTDERAVDWVSAFDIGLEPMFETRRGQISPSEVLFLRLYNAACEGKPREVKELLNMIAFHERERAKIFERGPQRLGVKEERPIIDANPALQLLGMRFSSQCLPEPGLV